MADNVIPLDFLLLHLHAVPLLVQQQREASLHGWHLITLLEIGFGQVHTLNVEVFLHLVQEHFVGHFSGKFLDKSIVLHNKQVVVRVNQTHEVVEWLLPSHFLACLLSVVPSHLAYVVGCLGPVVAVAHIEFRDFREFTFEVFRVFHRALPEGMSDTVLRGDIAVAGLVLNDALHLLLDGVSLSEGQENGSDVSILNVSELGSVFLLLFEGELVPLNEVLLVVLNTGEGH